VGDPTAVPDLLAQIDTPFETFIADGAYDGEPVSQAVLDKQPDAQVIIPPHTLFQALATRSETRLFKPLHNMGAAPGSKKRATTRATMLSLPCSVISAFSATP
jgi:hypothetical protein